MKNIILLITLISFLSSCYVDRACIIPSTSTILQKIVIVEGDTDYMEIIWCDYYYVWVKDFDKIRKIKNSDHRLFFCR